MTDSPHFLIIDSYSKSSRDVFEQVGMTTAGKLYAKLLKQNFPEMTCEILYSHDENGKLPNEKEILKYNGILWPGCNLTVYDEADSHVGRILGLVDRAFEAGVPQFGSCWAAQIAVYAAGGEVKAHPRGREMGVARKIYLSAEGRNHPMYAGKSSVFDAFTSHDDEITRLPEGAVCLASNDFTAIQSVAVKYKNGEFWAPQYHPEYDLHEMARLALAREEKLLKLGLFKNRDELLHYVDELETIFSDDSRRDLRWKYAIDDDLLSDEIRQCEFVNWMNHQVRKKNNPAKPQRPQEK
ncbi:MAG: type 1 glutamine amidotransferase [Calditrichaeota bacterium]|nr:MAG: type 1 glutamine amidotransferase [Calditrichota bacterium]